jgi:hypothetical protein
MEDTETKNCTYKTTQKTIRELIIENYRDRCYIPNCTTCSTIETDPSLPTRQTRTNNTKKKTNKRPHPRICNCIECLAKKIAIRFSMPLNHARNRVPTHIHPTIMACPLNCNCPPTEDTCPNNIGRLRAIATTTNNMTTAARRTTTIANRTRGNRGNTRNPATNSTTTSITTNPVNIVNRGNSTNRLTNYNITITN